MTGIKEDKRKDKYTETNEHEDLSLVQGSSLLRSENVLVEKAHQANEVEELQTPEGVDDSYSSDDNKGTPFSKDAQETKTSEVSSGSELGIDPQKSADSVCCPQCQEQLSHPFQVVEHEDDLRFCSKCQLPLVLVAGKYRLEKRLGEGGHGVVFLARHIHLHLSPLRVIKFLKPGLFSNQSARQRFLREIQTTASVSQHNDHIVRVFDDFGEIPNLGLFFVMEFLQGETLESLLQGFHLPMPWVIEIFYQLCEAVHAAHEAGIIHRDLKPSNIFLVERMHSPYFVKVMDFGIAKTMEPSPLNITRGHETPGTPAYMSPEQFTKEPLDHRTDIYCLGILLYEMLVGHAPFVSPDGVSPAMLTLAHAHLYQIPEQPSVLCPDRHIPVTLEQIVGKAMAKSPDMRFQSVHDILQILDQLRPQKTPLNLDIIKELSVTTKTTIPLDTKGIALENHPYDTFSLSQTRDTSPEVQKVKGLHSASQPLSDVLREPEGSDVAKFSPPSESVSQISANIRQDGELRSSYDNVKLVDLPPSESTIDLPLSESIPTLKEGFRLQKWEEAKPTNTPQSSRLSDDNNPVNILKEKNIDTVGLETIPEIKFMEQHKSTWSAEEWRHIVRSPWTTFFFWLLGGSVLLFVVWIAYILWRQ